MKKLLFLMGCISTLSINAQWANTTNNTAQDCISAFGKVFASDVNAGGLDVSSDNGGNWATSNTGVPSGGVYFGALSSTNLYAYTGNTVITSTTGNNWTATSGAMLATDVVKSMAVLNGSVLAVTSPFSGSSFKVFVLNGSTWALKSSTNGTISPCIRNLNGTLFAGTTAQGILKSTNGGTSFTLANTGMPTETVNKYILSFGATSTALFAGTYGGKICRSTDNGATWSTVYNIGDGTNYTGINDFYIHSNSEIFAATDSGFVYSLNNGLNWQKSNAGLNFANFENYMTKVTVSGGYIVASVKTMVAGKIVRMPLSSIIISGLNDLDNESVIASVYPNPSNSTFNIQSKSLENIENLNVTVTNALGQQILNTPLVNGTASIDLSNETKGIYFYTITNKTKSLSRGKLILN